MSEEQLLIGDSAATEQLPDSDDASDIPTAELVPIRDDPLTERQSRSLLKSTSVVRDPLHGDIRITRFERALIDTQVFQRLRHINQLAMVDVVYPGATHNRFLHSIGTLHVCAELMVNCRNSVKMLRDFGQPDHAYPVRISPYAELLARLVALLHDAAHVPFGHVFEREAQVFAKDEWEDPWRREQVFGKKSPLVRAARDFFVQHFAELGEDALSPDEARSKADAVLSEVLEVLTAKQSSILRLRYPFVADLVGNTICADLLDYVQRDMYFTGLTEGLAKRFLNHLAVLPTKVQMPADLRSIDKLESYRLLPDADTEYPKFAQPGTIRDGYLHTCRIVLLQYRYNSRRAASTKHNVLPEAIDLVRRRKLIAEKLYFHKTKLIATAMIGAAAHAADITTARSIWNLSDHEVLKGIMTGNLSPKKKSSDSRAKRRRLRAERLASFLLERRLFKPVYLVGYHPDIGDETGFRLWGRNGIYPRFGKPAGREVLIEKLEDILGLQLSGDPFEGVGKVAISCPEKRMQLKQFEMLVLPRPDLEEVRMLQDSVRPTVREEIDAIQHGHHDQWRLEVFVEKAAFTDGGNGTRLLPVADFVRLFAGAIQMEMGLPNELVDFRDAIPLGVDQLLRRMELERDLRILKMREVITEVHFKQLEEMQAAARGERELSDQLQEWGYAFAQVNQPRIVEDET